MIIPLQTFYVDNIGRLIHSFQFSEFGSFDFSQLNKSQFLLHTNHPLHFTSPIWLNFIGKNFHYLPTTLIKFEFDEYLKIEPSFMYINSINVQVMKKFSFTIRNKMSWNVLTINGITTFSPNVFVTISTSIGIKPNDKKNFNVYICTTEPGIFNTVLLISTSIGVIPYSITFQSTMKLRDTSFPSLFHFSPKYSSNISISIPPVFNGKHVSVLYDMEMISVIDSFNTMFVFGVNCLNTGFYISFFNLISNTIGRTFPMYFMVSNKILQSYLPLILCDCVTKKNEKTESDIILVNPTNKYIHIVSIHLPSDSPSNCRIEHIQPPLNCVPFSLTNVGKIVIFGTKSDQINTNVIITYESDDSFIQTIEIPVKAYISYGSLHPLKEKVEIIESNIGNFSFVNLFKENVAVFGVAIESSDFKIIDFQPFVVHPNELSKPIKFLSNKTFENDRIESFLHIETNITSLVIPIVVYNKNLMISKNNSFVPYNKEIFYSFPKIYGKTKKYISFFITNAHPNSYTLKFNHLDESKVKIFTPDDIKVLPFSKKKFTIEIEFQNITRSLENHEVIQLEVGNNIFKIHLTWKMVIGDLYISSSVNLINYGHKYSIKLFAHSTYSEDIVLNKIIFPNFTKTLDNIVVSKNSPKYITNYNFIFNYDFLRKFHEFDSYSLEGNSWFNTKEIPIYFTLKSTNNNSIKTSFKTFFSNERFNNLTYNFGNISLYSLNYGNLSVRNFFDVPVIFYIHNARQTQTQIILSSPVSAIVKPNDFFNISFCYQPSLKGLNLLSFEITTNTTKPFYLNINSYTITPQFTFINQWNNLSHSAKFYNMDSNPIYHSLFLRNDANISLPISEIKGDENIMKIIHKCPDILPIKGRCKINIFIDPKNFKSKTQKIIFTVRSFKVKKQYKIKIELNRDAFLMIQVKLMIQLILILLISITPIILFIYKIYKEENKGNIEYEKRIKHISKEIESLSVSKRASIGVQTLSYQEQVSGGTWFRSVVSLPKPTQQTIDYMSQLLEDIKL